MISVDHASETKIVEAIYRGACDLAELQHAIRLIAGYFESPGALVGELDQAHPQHAFAFGANTIDDQFFSGYRKWSEHDPAPRTYAALAVGKASITDRMFSESVRRKSEFLNEFLVPLTLDGSLGAPLLSTGSRVAMIGVFQGVRRRSFDDDDILRLERLTPHLTRSLQIRRLFLQSEARGKVLESIVERNETGMVGLRGEGPALFVNRAARAIAAARDGLGLDRMGRLMIADRAAAIKLAAMQADIARGGAGGLVRISRPSGLKPYIVLVSPLPSGDDLFPNSRGGVLFAIHDPAHRKTPTEQRIAELLHIPSGAAKVLQAILEGVGLKEYANRAGISMNTVRFHLKSAFALTGAKSQAELVRNAMSALNELGPYFSDAR